MDDATLRQTAESMAIKNYATSSRKDLTDAILDLQADTSVKDYLSKSSEKKKDNKEKNNKQSAAQKNKATEQNNPPQADINNNKEENNNTETSETPKKRGRKPKAVKQPAEAMSAENQTPANETGQAAKKRGRKKKTAEAVNVSENNGAQIFQYKQACE